MTDRKLLIEQLERLAIVLDELMPKCAELVRDAITLLKEHEPKPAVDIADTVDGIEVGRCPSCDKGIVNKKSDPTRYCKFCGQAVKWE